MRKRTYPKEKVEKEHRVFKTRETPSKRHRARVRGWQHHHPLRCESWIPRTPKTGMNPQQLRMSVVMILSARKSSASQWSEFESGLSSLPEVHSKKPTTPRGSQFFSLAPNAFVPMTGRCSQKCRNTIGTQLTEDLPRTELSRPASGDDSLWELGTCCCSHNKCSCWFPLGSLCRICLFKYCARGSRWKQVTSYRRWQKVGGGRNSHPGRGGRWRGRWRECCWVENEVTGGVGLRDGIKLATKQRVWSAGGKVCCKQWRGQ